MQNKCGYNRVGLNFLFSTVESLFIFNSAGGQKINVIMYNKPLALNSNNNLSYYNINCYQPVHLLFGQIIFFPFSFFISNSYHLLLFPDNPNKNSECKRHVTFRIPN